MAIRSRFTRGTRLRVTPAMCRCSAPRWWRCRSTRSAVDQSSRKSRFSIRWWRKTAVQTGNAPFAKSYPVFVPTSFWLHRPIHRKEVAIEGVDAQFLGYRPEQQGQQDSDGKAGAWFRQAAPMNRFEQVRRNAPADGENQHCQTDCNDKNPNSLLHQKGFLAGDSQNDGMNNPTKDLVDGQS